VLSVGLLGGAAWATPGQTDTQHIHGDATGLVEVDFNPNSQNAVPVTLPSTCWLSPDDGIVSTDGNAIQHSTFNKTGGWFTTTYTGGAAVYPLVLNNGVPVQDPNTGNNEVDTTNGPLATGHLTTWFGNEDNNKNGVTHATASFHGTLADGTAVNLNGHFQVATNANGVFTVVGGGVTC
jgi:hypothetical protein